MRHRADLRPHIELYEKNCNCKVDIPVRIVPIPKSKEDIKEGTRTLGICYGFKQSKLFRFIEIDETYWNQSTDCERESTVLHELGHCMDSLEHDSALLWHDFYLFIRPKSIMHPYSIPQYCNNKDEYRKEFFLRRK